MPGRENSIGSRVWSTTQLFQVPSPDGPPGRWVLLPWGLWILVDHQCARTALVWSSGEDEKTSVKWGSYTFDQRNQGAQEALHWLFSPTSDKDHLNMQQDPFASMVPTSSLQAY